MKKLLWLLIIVALIIYSVTVYSWWQAGTRNQNSSTIVKYQ